MSEKHEQQHQQYQQDKEEEHSGQRTDLPGASNPNAPWARQEEVGDIYSVEMADDGTIERADKLTRRPMVWVGSLADYNAGHLHGDWIDAAVEPEQLHAAVQAILATSTEPVAEEWGIFDYDEFGAFKVGEYESLEVVSRIALGIREHGAAFAAWAGLHDGDEAMCQSFEDAYLGHYDSAEDWAREVLGDLGIEELLGKAAPHLLGYVQIDYAMWLRDVDAGGEVHIEEADGGGVWVFQTL